MSGSRKLRGMILSGDSDSSIHVKAIGKPGRGARGSILTSPQSLRISSRSGWEADRPILNCNSLESVWSI